MTAATASTLGVRLTDLARTSRLLADVAHRDADGTWCEPNPPHVPGCTCTGGPRCDACWAAYLHHVAIRGAS